MISRIITAVIGLPVFLGLLYKGGYYTAILVLVMVITGITELFKIMKIENKIILFSLYFFATSVIFFSGKITYYEISIFFMLSLFIIYIIQFGEDLEVNNSKFTGILQSLFIYLYVTIPLYHIILIRNINDDFKYIFFMFIIIWVTDSFAYFTGLLLGKHKLAPRVSPNKTIEGSLGGSFFALLISLFINYKLEIFPHVSLLLLGLIILLLTMVSQLGDLFESSIKRIYNIKDSGKILPGHGGLLDRFDSTIFVAPVFYILLKFLII